MTTTLEQLITHQSEILIDTNILLAGFDFQISPINDKKVEDIKKLNTYIKYLLKFSQKPNSKISQGVYSEYRLIYNNTIRPFLDSTFFVPNLPRQIREEIISLKKNYRQIKQQFMNKKIEPLKLDNFEELVQILNNYQVKEKEISTVDIELFITGIYKNIPIITNDSDFKTIYNWFKFEFQTQFELPTIYIPIDFEEKSIQKKYIKLN